MIPLLRELINHRAVACASNEGDPLARSAVDQLQRRYAAAAKIVEALEGDDVLEHAALQLAWAQVLEHLLAGDDIKDCVAHIQKLASSSRASRRRSKGAPAQRLELSPETMAQIEDALRLM